MDILLTLGLVILLGVLGGELARKLNFPSVTGYLLTGILLGPSLMGLVDASVLTSIDPIIDFALGLIGLSLGGELKFRFLQKNWGDFGLVFLGESFLTLILVALPVYIFSGSFPLAVVLGVLATASAPASVLSTLSEKKATGSFPELLKSMVALDSLFCITLFSFATILLKGYFYDAGNGSGVLLQLGYELGLALLAGFLIGTVTIRIINRVLEERKRLVLLTGIIFLAVGVSNQLGLSYLLVTLTAGIMIVNLTPNFGRFFTSLHVIDTPVLVLFLTLAGASLELRALPQLGFLGVIYITFRTLGKIAGSTLGSYACGFLTGNCSHVEPQIRKYLGFALIPQAGIAVGLALLAEQELPLPEDAAVTTILGAIIFFQLVGPFLLDTALRRTDSI